MEVLLVKPAYPLNTLVSRFIYYSGYSGPSAAERLLPDGQVDSFLMEGQHADDFVQEMKNYDGVLMGGNTYEFGFNYGLVPDEPAYPGVKTLGILKNARL